MSHIAERSVVLQCKRRSRAAALHYTIGQNGACRRRRSGDKVYIMMLRAPEKCTTDFLQETSYEDCNTCRSQICR